MPVKQTALAHSEQIVGTIDPGVSVRPIGPAAMLAVIRQNLIWIGAVTVCAVALTVAVLLAVPPRYQSQALLVVTKPQAPRPVDGTVAAPNPTTVSDQLIASLLDEMTAAPLLRKVIVDLGLESDPEFNPGAVEHVSQSSWLAAIDETLGPAWRSIRAFLNPRANESSDLEVLDNVNRAISVSAKLASHTVVVSAFSTDPEKAAAMANTLTRLYLKSRLERQKAQTVQLEQWLGDRLAELRADVRKHEDMAEQVRAQIGHYQGQTSSILAEQLSQLSRELLETKAQLASAEAKYSQLRGLTGAAQGSAGDEVINSLLIQSLRQQEATVLAERAAAQSQLGARHPNLVALNHQVNEVRAKIATEISRVDQKIGEQIRVLKDKAGALNEAQHGLQGRIETQNAALVQLREVQNEADSNRATLQAFSIYRAKMAGAPPIEQTSVDIISPAVPATKPVSPNRKAIVGFVGFAALFVSVVAAVLWASFAQDLRSAEQAWALLGLRTLALVPKVRVPSPIDRAVVDMPGSAISESIRYLYTSIQGLLEKHPGCFRVLVSSAVPDEGKSTTARMLAREAALAGAKTLLLNLDLRRRRGTREQSEAPFGIQVDVEEDTGLHILEVHSRSRRSFTFLHQQGFWDQVEVLSCQYELMVIDSPPVLSVSDASTIARFTDSTIFIVRWAKTPIPAVVEALRQLRAINTKILGVVLTQVNARKHAMYSFGDSGVYRGKHKRYYLDDKVRP